MAHAFIGTSGWNYNHWKNLFYPSDVPHKSWFNYYLESFNTVEINSTFYHLPKKDTVDAWYKSTPADFIFSVKASRYITHQKKLNDCKEALKLFFESIAGLKNKVNIILFQLPPSLNLNIEKLNSFIELLPNDYRFAFEFRNSTWWNDDVYNMLRQHNLSFCIYELGGIKTFDIVTADYSYIRLHGPTVKYAGSYNDEQLNHWECLITSFINNGKDVYCYFDNDENAYAAFNAKRLNEMIIKRV